MVKESPPKYPIWRVRCSWGATAYTILVEAKNEAYAYDKACKRMMRTEGGESCQELTVLGVA